MSVPTPDALEAKKLALLERSLAFLRRSTVELVNSPADSVIHFAAGMELLLKTRLFAEHWTLILENPHGHEWQNIWNPGEEGKATTITAIKLIDAVKKVTGEKLENLKGPFDSIRKLRNKAMHLLVHEDDIPTIAVAQWSCWHQAYLLICKEWKGPFGDDFVKKATTLDEELVKNKRPYINKRFEEIQEVAFFKKAKHDQRLVKCPSCGLQSAVLKVDDAKKAVPCAGLYLFLAECYPCLAESLWATPLEQPLARESFELSYVNVVCPCCGGYGTTYQFEEEGKNEWACFSMMCGERFDIAECQCCEAPIAKRQGDSWGGVGTLELGCQACP